VPRWIQLLAFVLIIAFISLFAFGLRVRGESQISAGQAPDFSITSYDSQKVSLADLRGKVVVVNIWASWCLPCRDEAPFLQKMWLQYKDRGVVFVGVDYVDSESAAKAYIKEFGLTYLNGPDIGSEIYQRFRAKGVPETYFVGKDGHLYGNALGPISADSGYLTERQFAQKLEELLAKK
jgi:cytochrome c biogenesis protein CcmG, thiol:disulfide interchange protein DsbE